MTVSAQRNPRTAWSPPEFIKHVAAQELDEFCRNFGGFFLIVRLDDFSTQLAAGFEASRPQAAADGRRRITLSVSPITEERTVTVSVPSSLRPPARPSRPAVNEFGAMPEFLQSSCYVVELKKRWTEPTSTISVGRGLENDIVLQHPSVSKVHAHFDGGDSRLLLSDVGSRNHTYVKDELVSEMVLLAPGDPIKFGAVRCTVCSPAGLWHAVRQ